MAYRAFAIVVVSIVILIAIDERTILKALCMIYGSNPIECLEPSLNFQVPSRNDQPAGAPREEVPDGR